MSKPEVMAEALLRWYDAGARDLPWRRGPDPYATWVSEIMLQQTQVRTVIPYFERWMARFPDIATLATASPDEVLRAWEGLGYYSRARHLQAAAQLLVAHHGGAMPDTWEAVRRLPGVGDYTAGAILSIAFGQPVAAVDGNVLRVMSRLLLLREDVTRPATKRAIGRHVEAMLATCPRPGDLNQAFMDLGATVCTPTSPRCEACPLATGCRAWPAGEAEALPVKAGTRPPRELVLASVLVTRGTEVLLVKRASPGIWGGLWAPPAAPLEDVAPAAAQEAGPRLEAALAQAGWAVAIEALEAHLTHQLTHRTLTLPVFSGRLQAAPPEVVQAWVGPEALRTLALPVPFARLLRQRDLGPLFRAAGGPAP
ncbi:MAG: A/G-specific adenine glycosylase [Candidatus Sericytochromatia bacterium]|nr:A/G-specific adenine glycosylase [Candidatus Sericytochromatia bacterium]